MYLIKELNWMPLKLHFKSKTASFNMHKVHNHAVPESIREIFSVNSNQRYILSKPHANNLFEKSNLIVTPLHQYGRFAQYSKTKSLA